MMRRGFTIVETMLAVVFLATAALGAIQYFPLEISIGQSAKNRTMAAYLAQSILEEMTTVPYGDLLEGTYSPSTIPDDPNDLYTVTAVVSCLNGSLSTIDCSADMGLKRGNVTVQWRNKPDRPINEFHLGTLFTNN